MKSRRRAAAKGPRIVIRVASCAPALPWRLEVAQSDGKRGRPQLVRSVPLSRRAALVEFHRLRSGGARVRIVKASTGDPVSEWNAVPVADGDSDDAVFFHGS